MSFARAFGRVYSNELDASRFAMLKNNVETVIGPKHNVVLSNASILDHPSLSEVDSLFLDPEWGGPDYMTKSKLRLTISHEGVEDFVRRVLHAHRRVETVGLKLPCNYDVDYVREFARQERLQFSIHYDLKRMILIVLRR